MQSNAAPPIAQIAPIFLSLGICSRCSLCGLTDRASAAWHMPPTVAESPNVDARMLPDFDWGTLCHVSCSALLGSRSV